MKWNDCVTLSVAYSIVSVKKDRYVLRCVQIVFLTKLQLANSTDCTLENVWNVYVSFLVLCQRELWNENPMLFGGGGGEAIKRFDETLFEAGGLHWSHITNETKFSAPKKNLYDCGSKSESSWRTKNKHFCWLNFRFPSALRIRQTGFLEEIVSRVILRSLWTICWNVLFIFLSKTILSKRRRNLWSRHFWFQIKPPFIQLAPGDVERVKDDRFQRKVFQMQFSGFSGQEETQCTEACLHCSKI